MANETKDQLDKHRRRNYINNGRLEKQTRTVAVLRQFVVTKWRQTVDPILLIRAELARYRTTDDTEEKVQYTLPNNSV